MSAGLDASTVTPGRTAPEVSRTVPAIVACAVARAGNSITTAATTNPLNVRMKLYPPCRHTDAARNPLRPTGYAKPQAVMPVIPKHWYPRPWAHSAAPKAKNQRQPSLPRPGVGIRLYLNTSQNIDQLAERATRAGITLDSQPHDTGRGGRAFDVTEPSGFKVTIAAL